MEIQTVEPHGLSRVPEAAVVQPRAAALTGDGRQPSGFQYWKDQILAPGAGAEIDFTDVASIPPGKRAVIELVTATIQVPAGESARLRMSTSLGEASACADLTVIPQKALGCACMLLVSQALRAYSDRRIAFHISRNHSEGAGYALICISGHFVDA